MSICFLDTETSGVPIKKNYNTYHHPSKINYYNSARLVELAYIICDEHGQIIKSVDTLIKPHEFKITNDDIHGITHEDACAHGININDAIKNFENDIKDVKIIVAHNIMFDLHIIVSECFRIDNISIIKSIDKITRECTMDMGKTKMKTKKNPKLIELYKFLFDEELKQTHRALADTEACMKCYYEMKST